MNLTKITDDCLERLARGESIADCLARYPEAADELAPILSAAEQLRVLSQVHLTEGQRLRAKVALREELAALQARRESRKHALGFVGWARLRVAPLAAMVAVLLFVSVAFTAVAASQPGDLVYPVRVAVERAPALMQPDAARRAAAELAVAERRLADLTRDQARHAVAVDALLRSDFAAAERADSLSDPERAAVMARLQSHAEALGSLANQAADPQIGARLRDAAAKELALARQLAPMVRRPEPESAGTMSPMSPTPIPLPVRVVVTATGPKNTETAAGELAITPGPTAPKAVATMPSASATPRPRPTVSNVPPRVTVVHPTHVPPRATVVHPTNVPPRATVVRSTHVPPRATVVHPTHVPPRATVVHPTNVPPRATVVHPTRVPPHTVIVPTSKVPTAVVPRIPPTKPPDERPDQAPVNAPTREARLSTPTAMSTPPP